MTRQAKKVGMKVCHLSTVHSCFDSRIFYKECGALSSAGYDVSFIVTASKDKTFNGIRVVALPEYKNRLLRITIKAFHALMKAVRIKAAVYHFHDPELIWVGISLKLLGKKVIFDLHEPVHTQIEENESIRWAWLRSLLRKIYLFFEFTSVYIFDQIVLAVDWQKEYFLKKHPQKGQKFTVIKNFSLLLLIDKAKPLSHTNNKFIVVYVGLLTRVRGIKEMIEAVGLLNGKVELWLLGKWETDSYKEECEALAGAKYARYLGYKKMEEIYSYIKAADIGLALLYKIENYLISLPTKVFEYMACRIPIIISDFPLWKDLFSDCALFADSQNPEEIAEKIRILIEDEKLRRDFLEKGRKLVESQYSWERESKRLVGMYEIILRG